MSARSRYFLVTQSVRWAGTPKTIRHFVFWGIMTSGLRFIFGPGVAGTDWEGAVKGCEWRFVRSGSQLSLYEQGHNPTGHILTAWEAWAAYGPEVIDEAIERGSAVLKEKKDATETCLSRWREVLGISPSTLADAVNVGEHDVLAAETSSGRVSIKTLEQLAFGLGLDERMLSFKADRGTESDLSQAFNVLRESLSRDSDPVSESDVAGLAEPVSVMRLQTRLRGSKVLTNSGRHRPIPLQP